jgi:hypothetical protein
MTMLPNGCLASPRALKQGSWVEQTRRLRSLGEDTKDDGGINRVHTFLRPVGQGDLSGGMGSGNRGLSANRTVGARVRSSCST